MAIRAMGMGERLKEEKKYYCEGSNHEGRRRESSGGTVIR